MRDGVLLATDVHRPAIDAEPAGGPFPVILERTPYGKSLPSRSELDRGEAVPRSRIAVAAEFVASGYAVVYQDCRGRYGSEGRFTKYLSEAEDGEDTLCWLLQQPWCNGEVVTMGLSYAAHTQLALATRAPAGLRGFVLDSGGFSSAYECGIRQGGAFELKQATWAYNQAVEALRADPDGAEALAALQREDIRDWFLRMPWTEGASPLRWAPEYERYLFEQWERSDFGDYWKQPGIYALVAYGQVPRVPQVHMSSWYDVYVRSTLRNFTALREGHPEARLIMGPWLHGDRNITHCGDVDFGAAAAFDGNVAPDWRTYRRWCFDRWLQGASNALQVHPRVLVFLMGGGLGAADGQGRLLHGGRWIAADDWPLPGAETVAWHLRQDGLLDASAAPAQAQSLSYRHDPHDPVPTIGGAITSGRPVFVGGAFDQRESERFLGCRVPGRPLRERPDVLSFCSAPLQEDVVVVGPVQARLFISSDAPDTDFTIKLIDQYPPASDGSDGFALNLSDGILRCRYRNDPARPEPLRAGEVTAITVEAFATANVFRAGHRIRLDIASSNFPKYDINPGTGENWLNGRPARAACNTLHMGAVHPSRLELSVVPVARLKFWTPPSP